MSGKRNRLCIINNVLYISAEPKRITDPTKTKAIHSIQIQHKKLPCHSWKKTDFYLWTLLVLIIFQKTMSYYRKCHWMSLFLFPSDRKSSWSTCHHWKNSIFLYLYINFIRGSVAVEANIFMGKNENNLPLIFYYIISKTSEWYFRHKHHEKPGTQSSDYLRLWEISVLCVLAVLL